MTEKQLRKLSRADMLKVMIAQSRHLDELQDKLAKTEAKLAEAERALADRELKLTRAGSIAEASLQVTHIFEEAQKAADLYLENIKTISGKDALRMRRTAQSSQQKEPENG